MGRKSAQSSTRPVVKPRLSRRTKRSKVKGAKFAKAGKAVKAAKALRVAPLGGARLKEFFWPASLDLIGPIETVLLPYLISKARTGADETFVARDGLIPLLWFFHNRPKPDKAFRARILVHESLVQYVPAAWRAQVGTYRIAPMENQIAANSWSDVERELVLVSSVSDIYCGLPTLTQELGRIKRNLGQERLRNMKKTAYLPVRPHPLRDEGDVYGLRFAIELARELGSDIDVVSWRQFDGRDSYLGAYVSDLNEGLLCTDSYLVHLAASRGAKLLGAEPVGADEQAVQLSPYHCYAVKVQLEQPKRSLVSATNVLNRGEAESAVVARNYFRKVQEAMGVPENEISPLPWPRWFEAFAKSLRE